MEADWQLVVLIQDKDLVGWQGTDYVEAVNDGRMGKVRIHNVALTATECLNDFNQQKSIYGL